MAISGIYQILEGTDTELLSLLEEREIGWSTNSNGLKYKPCGSSSLVSLSGIITHSDLDTSSFNGSSEGYHLSEIQYNNIDSVLSGSIVTGAINPLSIDSSNNIQLNYNSDFFDIISDKLSFKTTLLHKLSYNTSVTITNPEDLVNKDYVDSIVSSNIWLEEVIVFRDMYGNEPSSPTTGDRYISTTTGGIFTENYIYEWNGTSWDETIPDSGNNISVSGDKYQYNGTSWISTGGLVLPYDDGAILYNTSTGISNSPNLKYKNNSILLEPYIHIKNSGINPIFIGYNDIDTSIEGECVVNIGNNCLESVTSFTPGLSVVTVGNSNFRMLTSINYTNVSLGNNLGNNITSLNGPCVIIGDDMVYNLTSFGNSICIGLDSVNTLTTLENSITITNNSLKSGGVVEDSIIFGNNLLTAGADVNRSIIISNNTERIEFTDSIVIGNNITNTIGIGLNNKIIIGNGITPNYEADELNIANLITGNSGSTPYVSIRNLSGVTKTYTLGNGGITGSGPYIANIDVTQGNYVVIDTTSISSASALTIDMSNMIDGSTYKVLVVRNSNITLSLTGSLLQLDDPIFKTNSSNLLPDGNTEDLLIFNVYGSTVYISSENNFITI